MKWDCEISKICHYFELVERVYLVKQTMVGTFVSGLISAVAKSLSLRADPQLDRVDDVNFVRQSIYLSGVLFVPIFHNPICIMRTLYCHSILHLYFEIKIREWALMVHLEREDGKLKW